MRFTQVHTLQSARVEFCLALLCWHGAAAQAQHGGDATGQSFGASTCSLALRVESEGALKGRWRESVLLPWSNLPAKTFWVSMLNKQKMKKSRKTAERGKLRSFFPATLPKK